MGEHTRSLLATPQPTEHCLRQLIPDLFCNAMQGAGEAFDLSQDYLHQDQLHGLEGRAPAQGPSTDAASPTSSQTQRPHFGSQWALLRFEQPITAPQVRPDLDFIKGPTLDPSGYCCALSSLLQRPR